MCMPNYCLLFVQASLIQQAHSEKHNHDKIFIKTEFLENEHYD